MSAPPTTTSAQLDTPDDHTPQLTPELARAGVTEELLHRVLDDNGAAMLAECRAAETDEEWTKNWGGPLAAALLTIELYRYLAWLQYMAGAMRADALAEANRSMSLAEISEYTPYSRNTIFKMTKPPKRMPA
jgi:hypothetical protein